MRLTPHEIAAIQECAAAHFGEGAVVRLFGSRVDDDLHGGDIDLHITTASAAIDEDEAEFRFKEALEVRIGERRVDVLVGLPSGPRRPIETIALATGILLPDSVELRNNQAARLPRSPATPMFSAPYRDILADAMRSGDRAKRKLQRLLTELAPHLPLNASTLEALPWEATLRTDSLLLQYTNMVAVIQDQLIRAILMAEAEPVARLSRLDQRYTMEKFGALPDGLDFECAANARNSIAHLYPADAGYQAAMVNEVADMAPVLITAFDSLTAYARSRGHVAI